MKYWSANYHTTGRKIYTLKIQEISVCCRILGSHERKGGRGIGSCPFPPHTSRYPSGTRWVPQAGITNFPCIAPKQRQLLQNFPHMSKTWKLYRNIHGNYKIIIKKQQAFNSQIIKSAKKTFTRFIPEDKVDVATRTRTEPCLKAPSIMSLSSKVSPA